MTGDVDGQALAGPFRPPLIVQAAAVGLGAALQTVAVHLIPDLVDLVWASFGEVTAWGLTAVLLGLAGVITTLVLTGWPGKAWKLRVAGLCGLGPAIYSASIRIRLRATGQSETYMDFCPLLDALGSVFIGGVGALAAVGAAALTLAARSPFERSR